MVSGRRLLAIILVVHLVAATTHGLTHGLVPVPLPPWQNALVVATTFLGPIFGVVLHARGHRSGLPLFTVSMAGAFLLGVLLHFVVESPDHVHAVSAGTWQLPFQVSAAAVALTPLLGVVVGAWSLRDETVTG
ncbi:hypothetical protein [Haloarchaeobius baliensis]|uniref:hypothetical protein n=1 Tax=Haloarchaeobius baliensis TaxID=1670458 RepID=UPI003F8807CD